MNNLKEVISQKKLVIFDMDGTIIDLEELNFTCFAKTLKNKINFDLDNDTYQHFLSGKKNQESFRSLLVHLGKTGDDAQDYTDEFNSYKRVILDNEFEKYVHVKPFVPEFLANLAKQDITYCVATSSNREFTELIIKKSGLTGFAFIITANEITKSKPDPEIFLLCCAKLTINPNDAIVFEDSINGIEAAANGTMQCVAVHNKGQNDAFVDQADFTIESYAELI